MLAKTVDTFKKQMGLYMRVAALLPGKESDYFEFLKFAGPTLKTLRFDTSKQATMVAMLANAGITGSQAGTYVRGMLQRNVAPSAVALDAARAAGIDVTKFMTFNKELLDPQGIVASIEKNFGTMPKKTQGRLKAAIDKYKGSDSNNVDDVMKSMVDILMTDKPVR